MEAQSNKTILLVEDAAAIQALLKLLFEEQGYTVLCASNGQEALDLLRARKELPAVIFLDLMMPVMDGFSFREEQEKDPRLTSIPVVIMTADGKVESKLEKLKLKEYIMKPVGVEDLLKTALRYCA